MASTNEYCVFFVLGLISSFLAWVYSFDHTKYITAAHPNHIKTFYDYFGSLQDWQRFYEAEPVNIMLDQCSITSSTSPNKQLDILEIGFGTGYLANNILFAPEQQSYHSHINTYTGIEVSQTMYDLAYSRLSNNKDIQLHKDWNLIITNSTVQALKNMETNSYDRVISTFVFDLLSTRDIHRIIKQLSRILRKDGKICLTSLTNHLDTRAHRSHHREAKKQSLPQNKKRMMERVEEAAVVHGVGTHMRTGVKAGVKAVVDEGIESVSGIFEELMIGFWESIARVCPICLGGCRPIDLNEYFDDHYHTRFDVEFEYIVAMYGIPSQVVIASEKDVEIKRAESFAKKRMNSPIQHRGHRS